jgi:uncharacterized lipoprotein
MNEKLTEKEKNFIAIFTGDEVMEKYAELAPVTLAMIQTGHNVLKRAEKTGTMEGDWVEAASLDAFLRSEKLHIEKMDRTEEDEKTLTDLDSLIRRIK